MKNIIEDNGKFAVKEIDEAGNSMGVGAERFDTKEEAQAFIDGAEGEALEPVEPEPTGDGQTAPHGAEGDTPDALVENAPENQPEADQSNGEVL